MTTWSGWAADFLSAASLPTTADNIAFMNEWAANANHPGCANNPIDLTRHIASHSSNCAPTTQVGVNVQKYASHLWARTAFDAEITSGAYPHLLSALKSGHPDSDDSPGQVATDLGKWSSTKFANAYIQDTVGSGKGLNVPHAHKGWADLRHSVNVKLPANLRQSQKVRENALRQLAQVRKVLR